MNFWISLLCAAIPSILFQGCCINAQNNSTSCPNVSKCDNNSSYNFWSCTPTVTCNRSESNTTCSYREFDFTEHSSHDLLRVWLDQAINFTCNDPRSLEIFGAPWNQTDKTVRFTKKDHGKFLSCYDDTSEDGIAGNFSVTIDLLMKPTTAVTRKNFLSNGGPLSMKMNFEANPTIVTKENITITHKNSTIADFYYSTRGLTHEILLYFEEVTTQNEGEYVISIAAVDSQCQPTNLVIVAILGKALHMGWIVSICLGGVSFVLLVAVIVCTISKCRKGDEYDRSNVELKTTRPAVDSTPVNGLHQQVSNPQTQKSRPQFPAPAPQSQFPQANPSYNRYSEDEFDSDDSDDGGATTNTLDKRPPMPLPKENPGSHSPRSPAVTGYVNGANNYPSPMNGNNFPVASRNLPPPATGRRPASPGNRSLPPPPTQPNFGYRGGPRY